MKILIAPNSFKECSNSVAISDIIHNRLKKNLEYYLVQKPISDGGDGFTEVCKLYFNGKELDYSVSTSYNDEPLECRLIYSEETKTVYIESANVLGLKVVPSAKRNPLLLTSRGLGELLIKLSREKLDIQKVLIGIGGTATIDMGLGACSALDLRLLDGNGRALNVNPSNYVKTEDIFWKDAELPFSVLNILDVSNPLIGKQGAAIQFGPQKGADEKSIELIENGFVNILKVLKNKELADSSKVLYGAGGGISAGLKIFLGSAEITAEKFILDDLKLEEHIKMCDIVITGEGAFDQQSFMGKGAGIVLSKALENGKKVILVCGKIDEMVRSKLSESIKVFEISSLFKSKKESILNFEIGLIQICDRIATMIK
jgi:glycerate kinase